jgi:hypothetical protein
MTQTWLDQVGRRAGKPLALRAPYRGMARRFLFIYPSDPKGFRNP